MIDNSWTLHRAGLINFWYYDEEIFDFADGKMLLRGANGSGKSVTMQSLITVLLDGRKTPDRLDPFGSRARRMEDYLLGEKDIVDRDERTGYLFLEYKRRKTEQYLTTGLGMQARRAGRLDSWGFVVLDNRRVGQDFNLYKLEYVEGKKQKAPLSRRELDNALENGGRVVRSDHEYMDLVNKHLFGFESPEAYKDLIKLLIQLRSPKLSRDFKPTVIYEILTDSLAPLTDEDLKPLADTIENIDQAKQQFEQLQRERQALARMAKPYAEYNRCVLWEKAHGLQQVARRADSAEQELAETRAALARYEKQRQDRETEKEDLARRQQALDDERQELEGHDVFRAEKEKQSLTAERERMSAEQARKDGDGRRKRDERAALRARIEDVDQALAKLERALVERVQTLSRLAEQACFLEQHQTEADAFQRAEPDSFDFGLWRKAAESHRDHLGQLLKMLRRETQFKQRHEEARADLDEARRELELARQAMRAAETAFEDTRDQLLEDVHAWIAANEGLLTMEAEEIAETARAVAALFEERDWPAVLAPVDRAYRRETGRLNERLAELRHAIAAKQRDIEAKQAELREWRERKDPEPPRHEDTREARQALRNAKVAHAPLYAAVEFKPQVEEATRERLEAALAQMGLLDALIVPRKDAARAPEHDRIFRPRLQAGAATLASLLEPTPPPDSGLDAGDIATALAGVAVDSRALDEANRDAALDRRGGYRIGPLRGHAPREENAVYIGKEARRRYRERQIARLGEELAALEQERATLRTERSEVEETLAAVERRRTEFPAETPVRQAFDALGQARQTVTVREAETERRDKKFHETLEALRELRRELAEQAGRLRAPLEEEACERVADAMRAYLDGLQRLIGDCRDYAGKRGLRAELTRHDAGLERDLAALEHELKSLGHALEDNRHRLERVEARLQDMGADEIRRRIETVVAELNVMPKKRDTLIRNIADLANQIENGAAALARLGREGTFLAALRAAWQRTFHDEWKLRLVPDAGLGEPPKEAPLAAVEISADAALKALGARPGGDQGRDRLTKELEGAYYRHRDFLVEYRPSLEETFADLDIDLDIDDPAFLAELENLRAKARRDLMLLDFQGRRVNPDIALAGMDKELELQKIVLTEKDRELYEEVILNNIGRIMTDRIRRTRRWVDEINDLMAERDTSSGLRFSLKWKPKTGDGENQLDTQDLVNLLGGRADLMRQEDIGRISAHFRDCIERARLISTESGGAVAFQQAVREALDYRRWFQFQLFCQKGERRPTELTDRRFASLSGGEKALAMYIPLFSAVYSRYGEARPDAPRIISLDEAFAGVDENNVRDMFDLMEKMSFNYIINSQALWGDYETVPALAIQELVRPRDADFVSVVRYYWNGKRRILLSQLPEAG